MGNVPWRCASTTFDRRTVFPPGSRPCRRILLRLAADLGGRWRHTLWSCAIIVAGSVLGRAHVPPSHTDAADRPASVVLPRTIGANSNKASSCRPSAAPNSETHPRCITCAGRDLLKPRRHRRSLPVYRFFFRTSFFIRGSERPFTLALRPEPGPPTILEQASIRAPRAQSIDPDAVDPYG